MKGKLLLVVLVLLSGCASDESKNKDANKKNPSTISLFNLSVLYSDAEQNISFPVWFNDSLIQLKRISSITRSVFDESNNDTIENLRIIPKRKQEYSFGKLGEMTQLMVSNYYDDKIISTIKIMFSKHDKFTGFSQTKINDELEYDHNEFPYIQMNHVRSNENVSVYKNPLTGQRLFIIGNEKHWKPLAVEKLCKPSKSDVIVLGNYKSPTKKYKVQNLVEEMDVRNFEYSNGRLKDVHWKDDPFNVKRSFEYDPSGHCIGFIDSTFSIGNYVSSMHYRIELKNGLPISVTRSVFRDKKEFVLFREKFEYTFKD